MAPSEPFVLPANEQQIMEKGDESRRGSLNQPNDTLNGAFMASAGSGNIAEDSISILGHLINNCSALLDQGSQALGNDLELGAYKICQLKQLNLIPSNNESNPVINFDSAKNGSHIFNILEGLGLTSVSPIGDGSSDLLTPTKMSTTIVKTWIEALSSRNDLLRVSIQSTVLIAIFLASVLANSFVFVVFCRKPALLSNSYRFVLNLAVCNCLMTVLVMPFILVSTFTQEWILGWGSCEIIGMMAILLFVASILTLLLIAMDRYHAIMKPLHYHLSVIAKHYSLCIAGVWVLSLLIALPPFLGWNHYSYQPGKAMCTVTWRSTALSDRIYSFSFVLLCFVIPYLVMLWVYICAFRTAQRTTARARRNSVTPEHGVSASDIQGISQRMLLGRNDRRRSSAASLFHNSTIRRRSSSSMTRAVLMLHRDDWKAAKTSLIVMSAFTVCWLPFFILITMEAIIGPSIEDYTWSLGKKTVPKSGLVIPYWLEGSALCLALAGCALNPLVYVFRSDKIKQEFKRLFCPRTNLWQEQEKETSNTNLPAPGRNSSVSSQPYRKESPILTTTESERALASSVCTGTSSVRMSPCSSSASITTSAVGQAARIAGAAASLVVTFNEDAKHKDGVCL